IEDERENSADSQKFLDRALQIFEQNKTVPGLARAHTAAASMAFQRQDIETSIKHAELGRRYAEEIHDRFTLAKNDWMWGKIRFFEGDREAAAAKFDAAKTVFEELDTPYELARLLFDVGLLREEPEE